jgi:hypothetical protein
LTTNFQAKWIPSFNLSPVWINLTQWKSFNYSAAKSIQCTSKPLSKSQIQAWNLICSSFFIYRLIFISPPDAYSFPGTVFFSIQRGRGNAWPNLQFGLSRFS